MNATVFKQLAFLSLVGVVSLLASGCGQPARESSVPAPPIANAPDDDASHGGWWCVEHGIPEEQCSMCSSKAADAFKAKGDWCEDHNRAESQCFVCEPSRADRFAKLYEAKFGHKPPEREE